MKAKLVGVQRINFTNKESGELVQGQKLHLTSQVAGDENFLGAEVSTIFLRSDNPLVEVVAGLAVPCDVELVYNDRLNGRRYLSGIKKG